MAYPIERLRHLLIEEKKKNSLEDFKQKLSLKNYDRLCKTFCSLLNTDISNFNYENNTKEYEYIITLIEYISTVFKNDLDVSIEPIFSQLNKAILSLKKDLTDKKNEAWFDFIRALIKKIEYSIGCLRAHQERNNNDKSYVLLDTLVYDTKAISLLEQLLECVPCIVNSVDEKEKPFFKQLVISFLQEIKEYNPNNKSHILYLDYVINTFLDSPMAYFESFKRDLTVEINNILQSIGKGNCTKPNKKEIKFFLEDLKSKLQKYIKPDREQIDVLNKKYGKSFTFPENVIDESKKIAFNSLNIPVIDQTNLYTITIDNSSLDICDDAISFEMMPNGNYKVYIHVADVTRYIKIGSGIALEAYNRCSTLYLDDNTVIPMLPNTINELCCLRAKCNRNVITCALEIDRNGEVVNKDVFCSVIKVKQNLSYKYADEVLDRGNIHDDLFCLLRILHEISCVLSEKNKQKRHPLTIESILNGISIKEHNELDENSYSRKMVAEFMMEANYRTFQLLSSIGAPAIYRVHEVKNTEKILRELRGATKVLTDQGVLPSQLECIQQSIIDSCFERAYYSSENIGHQGLGLEVYGQYTSSIRRYGDLLMQEIIKKFLLQGEVNDKEAYNYEKYVRDTAPRINDMKMINTAYTYSYNKLVKKAS